MRQPLTAPELASAPSLLRVTFPHVKGALWSRRVVLVGLALISVLLGFVPTLKSELESALIGQIDGAFRQPDLRYNIFESPLSRFASDSTAGLPEKLAAAVFSGLPMLLALGVYVLISLLGAALVVGSAKATASLGKEVFRRLRAAGLRRGLEVDPATLQSLPNAPGQYTMAIHQGATNAQDTYEYALNGLQQAVSLVTVAALLASKSIWLSLGCVALVGGQATVSVVQARRLRKRRNRLELHRNSLVARTDDILDKRELILAHEQQAVYTSKLDACSADYAEVNRQLSVSEALFGILAQLLTDYGRIALLVVALLVVIASSGSTLVNVGDAYFVTSIYVRLFVPVSNLLSRYDSIRRAEATSRTYLELLATPAPVEPVPVRADEQTVRGGVEISFDRVCFRYDARPVLDMCSFRVPRNSVTLLLGPSGCGKTTVARLLLGFWRPQAGRIVIDSRDASEMSVHDMRLLMSYVSQGDHIVDDTVRDNLAWSSPPPTDAQIVKTLVDLKVVDESDASEILDRPARSLSTGQQQRLSLARLMLDSAPFLVVDEPLTGVDTFTMRDVLPLVEEAIMGRPRTTLIISHKVGFVARASHVIVMDARGRVVEEGAPTRLLEEPQSLLAGLHQAALDEIGFASRRPSA